MKQINDITEIFISVIRSGRHMEYHVPDSIWYEVYSLVRIGVRNEMETIHDNASNI